MGSKAVLQDVSAGRLAAKGDALHPARVLSVGPRKARTYEVMPLMS